MNAERLLAHFERIAEAPDAIARLRRFILDLAVRGKLVPQDSTDEPARNVLERLLLEREKAWVLTSGRKSKAYSPPEHEEGRFELPSSWTWVSALELCKCIESGSTPSATEMFESSGDVPYIKVYNLTFTGNLDFSVKPTFISSATHEKKLARSKVFPGDVLMNIVGPPLGKTSIVPNVFPEWNINQAVVLFRPLAELLPDFLSICLRSNSVLEWILDLAQKTVGQVNISVSKSRRLPIPFPPIAEQRRIVAKTTELMGLCDQLEAARQARETTRDRLATAGLARLNPPGPETFQSDARFALEALPALTTRPDQIKALRQTILNLAVRGKLVPQDPTDEPASELLKRIAKVRTGPQAVKKARRNGETDVSNHRIDTPLPVGWLWTNIDEIALSMRYGTSTKCEYAAPGVPVLRIPNVSDGVVSLDDIKFGPLTDGEIRDLALNAGDLLMIRSNGSLDIVGRSAVVTADAEGMAFAGYLVRLRMSLAHIKPEYIWLAMNSTDVRDQIERPIRSAVGLKNVNLTEFGALTIPLPPLAEQRRIVAKVDALMALCDRLEASLTATAATRRRLLDALLAEVLAPVDTRELQAAE